MLDLLVHGALFILIVFCIRFLVKDSQSFNELKKRDCDNLQRIADSLEYMKRDK